MENAKKYLLELEFILNNENFFNKYYINKTDYYYVRKHELSDEIFLFKKEDKKPNQLEELTNSGHCVYYLENEQQLKNSENIKKMNFLNMIKVIRQQKNLEERADPQYFKKSKEEIKGLLKYNGYFINKMPQYWADEELVLLAIETYPNFFNTLAGKLKNNKKVIFKTVSLAESNDIGDSFLFDIGSDYFSDKEFAIEYLARRPEKIELFNDEIQNDPEVIYPVLIKLDEYQQTTGNQVLKIHDLKDGIREELVKKCTELGLEQRFNAKKLAELSKAILFDLNIIKERDTLQNSVNNNQKFKIKTL